MRVNKRQNRVLNPLIKTRRMLLFGITLLLYVAAENVKRIYKGIGLLVGIVATTLLSLGYF
jgi:hypothetical protein